MTTKPSDQTNQPGPSTTSVHGKRQANSYHAVGEPIVQSATYHFKNTADVCAFGEARLAGKVEGRIEYGRYGNPTVRAAELRLAALEGADDAILYSSGMAAITITLLSLLSSGDHVIITDDCYRRTREFFRTYLSRFGIEYSIVPIGDITALEAAVQPATRLIVSELPTNPYLRVVDLAALAAVAKQHNLLTLIDATFATPINLKPLEWGIDLVAHSATKYLGGHHDLLAGVVAGRQALVDKLREAQGVFGAILEPHNASLLLRGMKTLGLRVARQNASGQAVAEFLEAHPQVEKVWYPGLASHPDHAIAVRQMSGFGGVVSFTIKGDLDATSRFIDAVTIPLIGPSLGGTESLIEQPALISFYPYTTEQRLAIGISDNLVRLAIGIEDTEDLIADLQQAFTHIA